MARFWLRHGVVTGYVVDWLLDNCMIRVVDLEVLAKTVARVSPELGWRREVYPMAVLISLVLTVAKDLIPNSGPVVGSRRVCGGESESSRVKDYVMEWMANEINERFASTSSADNGWLTSKLQQKEKIRKKDKNRKPREL